MTTRLTQAAFLTSINHWLALADRRGNLNKLPFNIIPGERVTGQNTYPNTKRKWEQYPWNPPPDGQHVVPDPYASAKPTWNQLYGYFLEIYKQTIIEYFRTWTRQRICARIYMAHDIDDELMNHIQNNYTADQDSRRDRTVTVHNIQRDLIYAVPDLDNIAAVYNGAQAAVTAAIQASPED